MDLDKLKEQITHGENSRHQFKADINNADSLAAEMAAFANCEGGTILIGVADDGSIPGLSSQDVSRINQLISNTASQHVRSPLTVHTENIPVDDNRIEIISPGSLPNNLTVEKIRTGNSNIRNPILASFVAKKILPYRGLGSGIRRALEAWPDIDFVDDRDGDTFIASVQRIKGQDMITGAPLNDLQSQILEQIRQKATISYDELASVTGKDRSTVRRNVGKLKDKGLLQRIGSKKTGYWEVFNADIYER